MATQSIFAKRVAVGGSVVIREVEAGERGVSEKDTINSVMFFLVLSYRANPSLGEKQWH